MTAPAAPKRPPVQSTTLFRALDDFQFSDGRVTRVRAANAPAVELSQQMAETGNALLLYEVAAHCALDLTLEELRTGYGLDEITVFVGYATGQLETMQELLTVESTGTGSGEAPAETTTTGSSSATPSRSKRSATASRKRTASPSSPSTSSSPTT